MWAVNLIDKVWISIHAPREGCDLAAWGAAHMPEISIHAPREGCDDRRPCVAAAYQYFNPRTP